MARVAGYLSRLSKDGAKCSVVRMSCVDWHWLSLKILLSGLKPRGCFSCFLGSLSIT